MLPLNPTRIQGVIMSKYSFEFKLKVVKEYMGEEGLKENLQRLLLWRI